MMIKLMWYDKQQQSYLVENKVVYTKTEKVSLSV